MDREREEKEIWTGNEKEIQRNRKDRYRREKEIINGTEQKKAIDLSAKKDETYEVR